VEQMASMCFKLERFAHVQINIFNNFQYIEYCFNESAASLLPVINEHEHNSLVKHFVGSIAWINVSASLFFVLQN
jgi:hypothetical protein